MACICVYMAVFRDWSGYIIPGESALVQLLASDRRQARVVYRYARAMLVQVPQLAPLVIRETDELLELSNGISIEITTNSYRSVRGYTVVCALLDEVAYWRSDTSANPDFETLNAMRPAMATIPRSLLAAMTSPAGKVGVLHATDRAHWGKDGSVLVWHATTREMHRSFPQSIIDSAMELDPSAAASEYYGEYRADLEQWISRETIDALTVRGRRELPPSRGHSYKIYVDPSGGASNSFTLCAAHNEGGIGIIDLLVERLPPFSPADVVEQYAAICTRYGVGSVMGDKYGGVWVSERFSEHGIKYEPATLTTSDTYREAGALLMAGKAELLDHVKLSVQLSLLERRVTRGAREYISHPIGAHDDLATSACGALVAVAGQRDFIEMWKRLGG